MSIAVTYRSQVSIAETLATNVPAASSPTIQHTGYNTSQDLTANTTPPVSKSAIFSQALSTGAATIDLTALVGTNGAAVDGTALKVQAVKFTNPGTNANNITIAKGASNGYAPAGTAFSVTLPPGGDVTLYFNNGSAAIDSTHKTLDLTGTGSQALQCTIVMG